MMAYDKIELEHLFVQEQVKSAVRKNLLTPADAAAIYTSHPVRLYSPGWIARFGLYLATSFGVSTSMGLFMLLFMGGEYDSARVTGFLILIFGSGVLGFGDYFIRKNFHFKSGVDDALLYSGVGIVLGGLIQLFDTSSSVSFLLASIIGLLGIIRYNDRVMVLLFLIGLAGFVFYISVELGGWFKALLPFILFTLFTFLFFYIRKLKFNSLDFYRESKQMGEVTALLLLYVAVNYFVVREASVELMGVKLMKGEDIPLAWLFWFFTFAIPLACLYFGVRKKDIMLIRVAALFIAAAIFTVRYYFSIMPIEFAMVLGGLVLIGLGWWLMLFLKHGKSGFTSDNVELDEESLKQIESLIIAETFRATPVAAATEKFGGGNFGGGGAAEDY